MSRLLPAWLCRLTGGHRPVTVIDSIASEAVTRHDPHRLRLQGRILASHRQCGRCGTHLSR